MEKRVLLVDNYSQEKTYKEKIQLIRNALIKEDYLVDTETQVDAVIPKLQEFIYSVIVMDTSVFDTQGQSLLGLIRTHFPHIRCIILAKDPSIKQSVETLKTGAFDYVPITTGIDDVVLVVSRAFPSTSIHQRSAVDHSHEDSNDSQFGDIVGKSPEIQKVFRTIQKVANTDSTILITGESGTGKELIARAIHHHSYRNNAPMIVINCGAIPGELLESELFGHEKGAFTGAHRARIGRFEMADGGTLFLDEIGDMSPTLQVKLLRAIQEQRFERVGGMRSIQVNTRILSATNKDLRASVDARTFREDLFYRLNVIPIHVPALRNRKSDIPLLIQFFLKRVATRLQDEPKKITDEAINLLIQYDWPGNIRELENMMERLSVLVEGNKIEVGDLPEHIVDKPSVVMTDEQIFMDLDKGFNDAVEHHQRTLIVYALNKANWVKTKAAELLKLNRTTLVEKIKKLNIESPKDQELEEDMIQFPVR
ncbi:MAG: sigma-54-dependent Fis family transcriptional regulator [Desulfobacterales bacterium]|nr:sigma-54-dependent Fis family transcriptional regulator [Desulfobacterales bacterium]